MQQTPVGPALPKPNLLRWEIGAALLIKVLLLTGLWFLIFRWLGRPAVKPDIARHFELPAASIDVSSQPSQSSKEFRHVR